VDFDAFGTPFSEQCERLGAQLLDGWDTPIEIQARDHGKLAFDHVLPTGRFGRVDERKALCQGKRLVAARASLAVEDVVVAAHPPRIVSVGLPFVVAELASRAALARARPGLTRFNEADVAIPWPDGGFALFLYVPTPGARQWFSVAV